MPKAIQVAVIVLTTGLRAVAGDGQLKPVAVPADDALIPVYLQASNFGKPQADSGTVHPKAMVGTVPLGAGKLLIAIDAARAEDASPNLVRFDFSGKGRFSPKLAVPLRSDGRISSDSFGGEFGPAKLTFEHGGRTLAMLVRGVYFKSPDHRYCWLQVGAGVEGTCRFGDKARAVRIIDGTGDLSFREGAQVARSRRRAQITGVDTVVVDLGRGDFTNTVKAFYGQPIRVDDAWYRVEVSEDGKTVSAKTVDVPRGRIRINHPRWRVFLLGKTNVLCLSGDEQVMPVPVDSYKIAGYTEFGPAGRDRAVMECGSRGPARRDDRTIKVTRDQVTDVTVGSPLTAKVNVLRRQDGQHYLQLSLTDASGADVRSIRIPGARNGRPDPPRVKVTGADGKVVYRTTLEYG